MKLVVPLLSLEDQLRAECHSMGQPTRELTVCRAVSKIPDSNPEILNLCASNEPPRFTCRINAVPSSKYAIP